MPTMISEVYDAFVAAGAPDEKARKAAEAVATYDHRFVGIERELVGLRGDVVALRGEVVVLKADLGAVRTELALHRWLFGVILALQVAILARLFLA